MQKGEVTMDNTFQSEKRSNIKYFLGIDNGITGSVALLDENGTVLLYEPTPTQKCLNYTKVKEYINRLDGVEFFSIFEEYMDKQVTVCIERPMINPQRWKASVSAIRCDEATLINLEALGFSYQYIDSKQWQKEMLPSRTEPKRAFKGATDEEKAALKKQRAAYQAETKTLSLAVGKRLFPKVDLKKDADALLIAEWARRNNL